MKINYKIMWIDDKPRQMRPIILDIEKVIRENHFLPDIQKAFETYSEFIKFVKVSEDNEENYFDDCDLILVDYNISRPEDKEITGETIVERLRMNGIFTEVLFYSSSMDVYRKGTRRELDNVTYADKTEIVGKTEKLIKKAVRQGMNISNLRGYLMDSTSEFDYVCMKVAIYYFNKLSSKDKVEVISSAYNYVNQQFKSEKKKFITFDDRYAGQYSSSGYIHGLETNSDISDIDVKLNDMFSTKSLIMNSINRFRVLSEILRRNKINNASEIYLFDGKTHKDIYGKSIIEKRNVFGHSKLCIGEKCRKKIAAIEVVKEKKCGCKSVDYKDCSHSKTFTYEECLDLRKDIFKYYTLFEELLGTVR